MAKRSFRKILIKKHYHDFNAGELVGFSNGVAGKFSGYALVTTPIVTLIMLGSQITTLEGIIALRVTDKSPNLEQDEIDAMTILTDSLDALADQLEYLANKATPGDEAATISAIVFVGYQVTDPHGRDAQIFEVIDTAHAQATLTNHLPENKNTRAIYAWSGTMTPADDNSWSTPVFTVESKVTLTGLTADKRWHFRGAIIVPLGRNPHIDINVEQLVWETTIISAIIP